jgi:hypothetical protein
MFFIVFENSYRYDFLILALRNLLCDMYSLAAANIVSNNVRLVGNVLHSQNLPSFRRLPPIDSLDHKQSRRDFSLVVVVRDVPHHICECYTRAIGSDEIFGRGRAQLRSVENII